MNSSSHNLLLVISLVIVLGLSSCVKPSYGGSKYTFPFSKWRVTIINNQSCSFIVSRKTMIWTCTSSKLEGNILGVSEKIYGIALFIGVILVIVRVFMLSLKCIGMRNFLGSEIDVIIPTAFWAATYEGFSLKNIPQDTFEPLHQWVPKA